MNPDISPLINYLHTQQLQIDPLQLPHSDTSQQLFALFQEKEKTISALDAQLTKAKAEQLKNAKLISTLQDKITELCPNTNNTGSSFMMPSQFRDCFEEFIKNDFINVMGPLLSSSKAYVSYGREFLLKMYSNIKNKIDQKIDKICVLLNLKTNVEGDVKQKIKISLLKILQDNWEMIMDPFQLINLQYNNSEIKQIEENEDFQRVQKQFTKICSYMLLQEKEWELLLPQNKIQQYSKKQHNCIDGWIKEKSPIIYVVEGLVKGETRHQNLKNYVIPYIEEEEEFTFEKKIIPSQKQQPLIKTEESFIQMVKEDLKSPENSISIIQRSIFERSKSHKKSQQEYEGKPLQINEKKMNKNHQISEFSKTDYSKFLGDGSKGTKKKKQKKNKNCLISDPSFDEIIPLKLKRDELPLKKQSRELKIKRTTNSRKGSIGKIVGQAVEHKENVNSKNNKQMNYKQLIKQKILDDPKKTKTQRVYDRSKDEDRPLRATNLKKIREKYLNR